MLPLLHTAASPFAIFAISSPAAPAAPAAPFPADPHACSTTSSCPALPHHLSPPAPAAHCCQQPPQQTAPEPKHSFSLPCSWVCLCPPVARWRGGLAGVYWSPFARLGGREGCFPPGPLSRALQWGRRGQCEDVKLINVLISITCSVTCF